MDRRGIDTHHGRRPRSNTPPALAGLIVLVIGAACGSDDAPGGVHGSWESVREVVGDTTILRTISGSVWGDTMVLVPELSIGIDAGEDAYMLARPIAVELDEEGRIFVLDQQTREIRVFDANGRIERRVGREGEGPGEFMNPNAMRRRSDGRLVVRDQGAARFSVFSPNGDYERSWFLGGATPAPISFFFLTSGDIVAHPFITRLVSAVDYDVALLRFRADGTVFDTLAVPSHGYRQPTLELQAGPLMRSEPIPFTPRELWTLLADGSFAHAISDRYAIDLIRPDGTVLRVEREDAPVPVAPGEAAAERERIARNFQQSDPSWRWRGADIPSEKPPFDWFGAGVDGSLWVRRATPAREEPNPSHDPAQADGAPPTHWVSDIVFDVFDTDGRYMGPVRLPGGVNFLTGRGPRLSLDGIVLVTTHELGWEEVVRFRLVPAGEADR